MHTPYRSRGIRLMAASFTSPFFDRTEFNPETFCHSGDDSSLTALYEVLEDKACYPIRDREDFRSLLPG